MQCPFCGQNNADHAVICEACGKELSGKTDRVNSDQVNNLPQNSFGPALAPQSIILSIGETYLKLNIQERMIIGRTDPEQSKKPDIDLTAYGAKAYGVSRQHAQIEREDKILKITDLESTNGTSINNRRLLPNQPYILRDGDKICLGTFFVQIYFTTTDDRETG